MTRSPNVILSPETGSHYVAQSGLKLLDPRDPLASVIQGRLQSKAVDKRGIHPQTTTCSSFGTEQRKMPDLGVAHNPSMANNSSSMTSDLQMSGEIQALSFSRIMTQMPLSITSDLSLVKCPLWGKHTGSTYSLLYGWEAGQSLATEQQASEKQFC
ncbi:hypothetical protein AAY473_026865 [Plecturocebus cupreus]